jgi:hypothetical protein
MLLWYGEQDLMAPQAHGRCLKDNLFNATLTIRPSEGHFGLVDHFSEVLHELAEPQINLPSVILDRASQCLTASITIRILPDKRMSSAREVPAPQ